MSADERPLVSIVIPCHNEEHSLPMLRERLTRLWDTRAEVDWECVLVDDGSDDSTLGLLREWQAIEPRVSVISLSRNFGHQSALCAGTDNALGDAVVTMDADLQDPPEVVPALINKWLEGNDVVCARRVSREGETAFKRLTARAFYRVLRVLSDTDIPADVGDFRLLSRRALEALGSLPESSRFLRGLVGWIGFKQATVEYRRSRRAAGGTKYPLPRMVSLAIDGVTSFSTAPLRFISYLGVASMALGFAVAIWAAWARFANPAVERGWASLMVAVCVLQGVNLLCIGIVGEYLGRVLLEAKRRPLYVIRDVYRSGVRAEERA